MAVLGRTFRIVVTLGVLASTAQLLGATAAAQTLSEGEIAVIQPKPVLVQHRVEFLPRFGVSFNDPLISQFHTGGSLNYHISESFFIGGTFEWYDFGELGGTTDTYDEVIRASSAIPEIAPVTYYAGADFGWIPINGKFSLFDVAIVYYDIYGVLGGGVIDTVGDPHPAGSIGIGQRTFLTDWLALLIEVRDRAYVEPLPSGDSFTNIVTAAIGLGFFVPTSFRYAQHEEQILDWE